MTGDTPVAPGATGSPASRLVVVGASAGGLEALTEFLGAIEPGLDIAYVVAQHLAPTHPSLLVDLLAPATRLQVRLAEEGDVLARDIVLVIPPDRDVELTRSTVRMTQPEVRVSPRPSIDRLFQSAADAWGEALTAVVLSGTGSDGSQGLRSVHAAGGLTLVQRPDSARFAGMPEAALAMGVVDLVADPRELGTRLSAMDPRTVAGHAPEVKASDLDMLRSITAQLRRLLGMDFSGYKESTLNRQVRRRMAICQADTLDDYFALLAKDREEAQRLADNLLVTVTAFFRDPDAFAALRSALVTTLASREQGESIRVWVPGCATGEEVYSLGMLISDVLGHPSDLRSRLKIFGTDMDESSLAFGRRARYPMSALERIPPDYRSRFTVPAEDGFVISDDLRACTVFARHDVLVDPPFPRIDLVSCRNTLIYFTAPLQERAIAMFGYSLNTDGLLFLGKAENLERGTRGFSAVDPTWRIFTRTHEPVERPSYPSTGWPSRYSRAVGSEHHVPVVMPAHASDHDELLEALVRSTGQVFMVVDEDLELIEVVGDVSPFCRVPEGRVTTAALSLLRPELQEEARALLLLSRTQGSDFMGVREVLHDPEVTVHLEVRPLQVGDRSLQLLVFDTEDRDAPVTRIERDAAHDGLIRQLESQLLESQRTLRQSLADLQATNEELEVASEELQASSEELQAANEELESSNEELQATNEELGTLNQELRSRAEQLASLNEVLENIQNSLDQGMVILDARGAVLRYSASAVRLFGLMESDIGQPLDAVPTTIAMPALAEAVAAILAGERRRSLEVASDQTSYLLQVLPYLDGHDRVVGAIITMTDVTEMLALRTELESTVTSLREQEVVLRQQATYDAVTGLLNRGAFSEAVSREIARARRTTSPLALIWADIDHFKEINDGHGHEAGDAALRLWASRISATLRDADFVGRLGGDEFGIVISDYHSDAELDGIVERIVVALREPLVIHGRAVRVSGSLGVALFPDDAGSAEDLLRAADAAMYVAKRSGGDGHAYFDESMNRASDTRRTLRERLDVALLHREFALHYQPIVTVPDGRPWGVEALLRWNREGGVVGAGEFIPFAEETGQIRALGMETLALLRDDLATLRGAGFTDLVVSVNMSVLQLEDRALAELLSHWPTPGGLEGITVEILESAFLPDRPHALELVRQMADLGARIAVDDYGSGYSNLKLLETLSPDFLKLDRSFLTMHRDPDARQALIRSAVVIAEIVGAKVIAEGVEDDAELRLLEGVGVDMVQGFLVADPMPVAELQEWLTRREGR